MNEPITDGELLRQWVNSRSEPAFTSIVERHVSLVYGAALRQVRRPELADEVTQAVFALAAQKAPSLQDRTFLGGWLFLTTRHLSQKAIRAEARRTHWEREAAATAPITHLEPMPTNKHDELWPAVEQHLDAAMGTLRDADRDALLLRFFKSQPMREVAAELGVSEDAAKKRVARALDKLRGALARKGLPITAAGLGALLTKMEAAAVPPNLCERASLHAFTSKADGPASDPFAEGLVSKLWERLSHPLPFAAALLLLMVGGVAALKFSTGGSGASAAAQPASLAQSENALRAQPARETTNSTIHLTVLSTEGGQPLQATVVATYWLDRERSVKEQLATDANGELLVPLNRALHRVGIFVVAAEHVPMGLGWDEHELVDPLLEYQLRLDKGRTIKGVVQTSDGAPIQNAKFRLHTPGRSSLGTRASISYDLTLTAAHTDAEGRFTSSQLPRAWDFLGFSVVHDDFVAKDFRFWDSTKPLPDQIITLEPGLKVKGTVVDPFGVPVAHATVRESSVHRSRARSVETDAQGRFEIGPFAAGSLLLSAALEGYEEGSTNVIVSASATNVQVPLKIESSVKSEFQLGMEAGSRPRLMGGVFDHDTGKPIPRFSVLLDTHRGSALRLIGEGQAGRFEWSPFMAFFDRYSLRVEADGYEPAISSTRKVEPGPQHFEFRLTRTNAVSGRVLARDGAPLRDVMVFLNGMEYGGMLLQGSQPMAGLGPQTVTDAEGRFTFPPREKAESVLCVHESGTALVAIADVHKQPIRLLPWGSVEGVLLVNGQPKANESVIISQAIPTESERINFIDVQARSTTDAQGRFRFEKLPAGPVMLTRDFYSNGTRSRQVGRNIYKTVEVIPGQTTSVKLGEVGTRVIGRFALPGSLEKYTWGDDLQTLTKSAGAPAYPTGAQPGTAVWREYSRQMKLFHANRGHYYLQVQPDGSFQIDDVAAGDYLLEARFSEKAPLTDAIINPGRPLGKHVVSVHVPETSSGTLDLGVIPIPSELQEGP